MGRSGHAGERSTVRVLHPGSPASPADGVRVLVDRRWPPGLAREQVDADLWLREVAPSDALQCRFGAGAWQGERAALYRRELEGRADLLRILVCPLDKGPLTLSADGKWLINPRNGYRYPIRDGIPVMLIEEGKKWKDTAVEDFPVPVPSS